MNNQAENRRALLWIDPETGWTAGQTVSQLEQEAERAGIPAGTSNRLKLAAVTVRSLASDLQQVTRERDGLRAALRRQTDNVAFILNRVDLHKWHDKFEQEMTEDRTAFLNNLDNRNGREP